MDQLIQAFSGQIKEALEINEKVELSVDSPIHNIILCGLGGSGIGGKLVSEIASDNLTVPFTCNHDYSIPAFVGENTLAIISSYSGNTEETLEAFDLCRKAGAQILCITSGGQLEKVALEEGYNLIKVPGGNAPRTCVGYSIVSQLVSLSKLGLTKKDYRKLLKESISFIDNISEYAKNIAMEIASEIHQTLPIIYTSGEYSGTGVRLKQQLNENAKMLSWTNAIPEMNHNELVGWASGNDNISAIFFEPEDLHPRNRERFTLSKTIIRSKGAKIIEIKSKGSTKTERFMYYIHVGDWLSYFLSVKNGVDPFEIEVIDHLKDSLASF
jgi:glucose/mannose-6-phosphate isomerase